MAVVVMFVIKDFAASCSDPDSRSVQVSSKFVWISGFSRKHAQ